MDRRKFLLIIGIIVGIIAIIFSVIYFGWKKSTQTSQTSTLASISTLADKTYSPQYITSQNALAYFNQGYISKYSFSESTIAELFPDKITYLQNIELNPAGNRCIALVKSGENYIFEILDFQTKQITGLSENVSSPKWLNDEQLIYFYSDDKNNTYSLNISDPVGNNEQKLTDFDFSNGIIVLSPDKTKVIIYPEPEGYGENFIVLYDLVNQKLIEFETKGLVGAVWSPDSQKIITNLYNEDGTITSTFIMDINTQKTKKLDLQYLIEKIVWLDNDNLVAVKNEGENTTDVFYLVSAKNGKSKKITLDKSSNFFLEVGYLAMKDSQTVLFTNNDFLYQLTIK